MFLDLPAISEGKKCTSAAEAVPFQDRIRSVAQRRDLLFLFRWLQEPGPFRETAPSQRRAYHLFSVGVTPPFWGIGIRNFLRRIIS
jgi:hypothetical protein